MLEGKSLRLGENEYILPRLNLKSVKDFWPKIIKLRSDLLTTKDLDTQISLVPDLIAAQTSLVHAALRRNYPDIALETVEEGMDASQLAEVFTELLSRSGFALTSLAGEAVRP